jgi:hypothetical protein
MTKITSLRTPQPQLPPFVGEAVEQQQRRVHALRSLIQCYQESIEAGNCSDVLAAGNGLLDLADSIVLALDPRSIAEAADELRQKKERVANREEPQP